METTKKNLQNGKLLLMFILFVVFQTASVLFYGLAGYFDLSWTVESVLMAVMCCLMYCSYRAHTKNVMKPLLGASLILILSYNMDWALYYLQYFDELKDWYPNVDNALTTIYPNAGAFRIYAILQVALFVVLALINIMHYVINATHHSSPKKILFNKWLYVAFVVFTVAQCFFGLFLESETNVMISDVVGCIGDVFMLCMVIIIESSLDEFRIAREAKADAEEPVGV